MGESDRDFLYSSNVTLSESVSLEMVVAELKERCGGDAKVGPSWDDGQRGFVEVSGSVGVYLRDCPGVYTLEYALHQVRRRRARTV